MKAVDVYEESERRYPLPEGSPVDREGQELAAEKQTAFEYGAAWAVKQLAAEFARDSHVSVQPTKPQIQEWLNMQAEKMVEIEP